MEGVLLIIDRNADMHVFYTPSDQLPALEHSHNKNDEKSAKYQVLPELHSLPIVGHFALIDEI